MLYIQTMLLPCRRIGGIRSCFCSCSIYFIIDFYKDIAVSGSFCCSFKFVRLCLSLCSKYLQITLPYEAPLLSKATRSTAAIYLACGVDSSKVCLTVFWLFCMCTLLLLCIMTLCFQASIFVQSHVRAHVELMWLLSSSTPIGWLNRMIQFKEKSRKAVRHLLYDSFHHQILFEKLNMLWEGTRNIDVSFIVNIFFFVIQTPAEIMNDMQLFLQFKMLSNNMHMSTSY